MGRDVEGQGHEMTSIAVISSGPGGNGANPLRAGAGPTVKYYYFVLDDLQDSLEFGRYIVTFRKLKPFLLEASAPLY